MLETQAGYAISATRGSTRHDIIGTMKMADAVAVLDALAQEVRLRIFRYLIQAGPPGASAGSIADHFKMHAATLSFHLNALRHAGLVTSRRESRSIIYSANYSRMDGLMAYLMANCCHGEPKAVVRARVEGHTC